MRGKGLDPHSGRAVMSRNRAEVLRKRAEKGRRQLARRRAEVNEAKALFGTKVATCRHCGQIMEVLAPLVEEFAEVVGGFPCALCLRRPCEISEGRSSGAGEEPR
jgi:hypothetical protein